MSVPSDGSPKSFTPQEIDAWLCAATEKLAALHIKTAGQWNSQQLHEAFAEISALLQGAVEEVRVASESLREMSQAGRARSADLRARSIQLIEKSTQVTEHMAQCVPSPREIQEAESRLLDMFKDAHKHEGA
jgi:hypothetical protein